MGAHTPSAPAYSNNNVQLNLLEFDLALARCSSDITQITVWVQMSHLTISLLHHSEKNNAHNIITWIPRVDLASLVHSLQLTLSSSAGSLKPHPVFRLTPVAKVDLHTTDAVLKGRRDGTQSR